MGDIAVAPDIIEMLKQSLAKQPGPDAVGGVPGPVTPIVPSSNPSPAPAMMSAAPPNPLRSIFGMPMGMGTAAASQQPTPQPATPKPPTDDPAISGIPTPPDMSNSPVVALNKQYQDTLAQRSALKPPTYEDNKPKWWERLLGGVLGATQLKNPENAGEVASSVANRRMNRANTTYGTQKANLEDQLRSEREGLEGARAQAEIPQRDFENKMQVAREKREQQTAQSNADYKSDLNDIRTMFDKGRLEEAEKRINETAEKNKNSNDRAKELLDLKQQMVDLKEKQGDKKSTPGQNIGVENKKSAALSKAHSDYVRATRDLPTDPKHEWTDDEKAQLQQAKDNFDDAQQAAQNSYEADVAAGGGTAEHQDVTQGAWRGKKPTSTASAPSSSTPPASLWAGKETKVLTLKGPDGKQQKWKLVGKTPTLTQ